VCDRVFNVARRPTRLRSDAEVHVCVIDSHGGRNIGEAEAADAGVLVWARSFPGRSYRRYGDVAGTIWMGLRAGRLPISASDSFAPAIKRCRGRAAPRFCGLAEK
jgi:hypothetical protein